MAGKYIKAANGTHKKRNIALILVAILVAVSAAGFVTARYVSNYQKEAVIHASDFHFSSNYLSAESPVPEFKVSDWGSNNITFYLYNYEVENVALISDTAIQYKITVSPGWNVQVQDMNGHALTATDGVYTMAQSDSLISHKVTLTGGSDGSSVNVTVESTSPYKKELKAKFNLTTKKGIEYTVTDKGYYTVIEISTNDFYGTVKVGWNPATHSPDNTCPGMTTWLDSSPVGELAVNEYTTYTLIFVENAAGNYTDDNFSITTGA